MKIIKGIIPVTRDRDPVPAHFEYELYAKTIRLKHDQTFREYKIGGANSRRRSPSDVKNSSTLRTKFVLIQVVGGYDILLHDFKTYFGYL